MTTSRFNPDETADHGKCSTCGIDLPTEQEANDHLESTYEDAKASGGSESHSIRTLNPSRPDRIDREIRSIIDEAIEAALDKIDYLIAADHLTKEEATGALTWFSDFSDAWEEHSA